LDVKEIFVWLVRYKIPGTRDSVVCQDLIPLQNPTHFPQYLIRLEPSFGIKN